MDTRLDNTTRIGTVWRKLRKRLFGCVSLHTDKPRKGTALISYLTEPFLRWPGEALPTTHSSYAECREMARMLLDRGFDVDVIQWDNASFIPKNAYDLVVDIQRNLERMAPYLKDDCKKIMHIVSSYWEFQNRAEQQRLDELFDRNGARLQPRRMLAPSNNIFFADHLSGVGTETTFSTYPDVGKSITPIPLSTTVTYPSPEAKDFNAIKTQFVWIGGGGAVHKGLDLLLEIFSEMPEYTLTVLGPIFAEEDFVHCYDKELRAKNIRVLGRIDPGSETFRSVVQSSVALVYPSCSEGQAGSVITAMHAGLIPVVSANAGVDVEGFGITLETCTKEEIKNQIVSISHMPSDELRRRAIHTWETAREKHTLETFSSAYQKFLDSVLATNIN